jgi:peptidoglycan hydrolase FlgJ
MSIPGLSSASSIVPSDIARDVAHRMAEKLNPNAVFSLADPQIPAQDNAPSLDSMVANNETAKPANEDLRKAFQDFVGQTFFSQMIASMRKTTQGAAYFNGGQAEKIFQGQLDQKLSEQLSEASASSISDPMFKLFQLRRGA